MEWIEIPITNKMIENAKRIRNIRDEKYGNIFNEEETDLRWCGDLGEICFNKWLKNNGIFNFDWILENVTKNGDFLINGKMIDIKTVKRKSKPLNHYTAQITARHKDAPVDHLFFMCYEYEPKNNNNGKMWLLGGCEKEFFIINSKYYAAGEYVHPNYQIRKGHEIYNAEFKILTSPKSWLNFINNT